jgi:hypothetical protein
VADKKTATATKSRAPRTARTKEQGAAGMPSSDDYVVPLVHVRVSSAVVEAGFWGGLAGAMALGVLDPPLGVLVGAGVVVARHQRKG